MAIGHVYGIIAAAFLILGLPAHGGGFESDALARLKERQQAEVSAQLEAAARRNAYEAWANEALAHAPTAPLSPEHREAFLQDAATELGQLTRSAQGLTLGATVSEGPFRTNGMPVSLEELQRRTVGLIAITAKILREEALKVKITPTVRRRLFDAYVAFWTLGNHRVDSPNEFPMGLVLFTHVIGGMAIVGSSAYALTGDGGLSFLASLAGVGGGIGALLGHAALTDYLEKTLQNHDQAQQGAQRMQALAPQLTAFSEKLQQEGVDLRALGLDLEALSSVIASSLNQGLSIDPAQLAASCKTMLTPLAESPQQAPVRARVELGEEPEMDLAEKDSSASQKNQRHL